MAKYVRPTLDTKFHIDFSWWQKQDQNLRAYLRSHSCPECLELARNSELQCFDWISPETGEVFQIDILWHIIHNHCGQDPAFLDNRIPLTSAIFRTFIISDNTPLTPIEIHEQLHRKTPDVILKTVGSRRVYKGIKPIGP